MSSFRAYRYQLRARPDVAAQLRRYFGMCRWVWNAALAEQRARYARGEKYASYADTAKWLTAWRNAVETSWLAEGPVHPQQQVLRRLDEAYKRFFDAAKSGTSGGRGGVARPRFKRRGQEPGICFPDPKQFNLDAANGRLRLPKLGWVRMRMSQPPEGVLRNVSVTREGSGKHERWFASLHVQTDEVIPALDISPTLGIDLGLTAFAATSDGTLVEPLKALANQQRRLKRYQRSVSRKKKGSANRRKAVAKLGDLHRRIARQRGDWLHKLTTNLANRHPVVALEDLHITNMAASAKGTAEAPGRQVAAKAGLNRSILDAAWGEFSRLLSYKTRWRGGQVILVKPAYTSRTCRVCGHESAHNRKTQSVFCCVSCNHTEHADVHAAKNILAAGHAAWSDTAEAVSAAACGEAVSRNRRASAGRAASEKQEPAEARAIA